MILSAPHALSRLNRIADSTGGDCFHNLAGALELLEQAVDISYRSAAAFGYPAAAGTVDYSRILPLIGSHGEDDGLDALEGVVVDVHVLESLAHTGYHGCEGPSS